MMRECLNSVPLALTVAERRPYNASVPSSWTAWWMC